MAQHLEAVAASKPWYKKWWGVLIIFFTWPISLPLLLLFLIWQKSKMSTMLKVVLSVVIIIAFGLVLAVFGSDTSQVTTQPSSTNTDKTPPINDRELVELTSKAIDAFKIDDYTGDVMKIGQALNFFGNAGLIGHQAVSSTDPEVKASGEALLKTLSKGQVTNYPKLRKAYVELVGQKLWVNDIDVSVSGSLNENITFVGGVFAANKNILEFHQEIEAVLTRLRFDHVNYKWIPSASEWTYFDLKAPKDSSL
jgi:hypothetical protein